MAKFKLIVTVEYNDGLQGTADYVFDRMESKINKVLQDYSKEVFNGSFVISPAELKLQKEKEKKNA
jgi:hypothetical protein